MKKILAIISFGLLLAAPAFAAESGYPNANSCGIGSFVLVRRDIQQTRHLPPMFVYFDNDGDDTAIDGKKGEGRSDTFYMVRHQACIDAMQSR
ncbi:MAG: hypothetical protein A3B31_02055 [Candidatus Komeilibacteria bacterium RIFCSPLOWO2_01_FULL_53_11]|uniref:Uncharacterized protein n=1 Tax=Candidatus Komeilibacteria bacterium RIFCSPLOWO2_01_FULL_53_11 TaxID=1798552 RepID=A0A1G2BQU7_9BACT|nr:MAG: hypothetical protein A3B31_02055 [Candidatus Komeilibacteria bacterium RIFCSPLOWO2_01_FULL_53_11]